MRSKIVFAFFLFLSSMTPAATDSTVIDVESWKKGQQQIKEQKLSIQLNQRHPTYKKALRDFSGKERYTLKILHTPPRGDRLEYWWVTLYENDGKKLNLIQEEGPGPNKHNFPRGDYIGVIYPLENPPTNVFEMIKLNTGLWIFPIRVKRIIKIESFYCVIQVSGYTNNATDLRKIDKLNLEVSFMNNLRAAFQVPLNPDQLRHQGQ